MRSLASISSIHELTSISIDFVLDFPQDELDVDVFMEFLLVMGVGRNIVKWVLNLSKSLYGCKHASANWFDILKLVYKGGATINLKLTLVYFTEKTRLFKPTLMIV